MIRQGVLIAMIVIGGAFCASCGQQSRVPREPTIQGSRTEVKKIAYDYMKTQRPDQTDELSWEQVVADKGDAWEYTFIAPKTMFGGTMTLVIPKSSMKVTRIRSAQ
jgi:hypothetical protein